MSKEYNWRIQVFKGCLACTAHDLDEAWQGTTAVFGCDSKDQTKSDRVLCGLQAIRMWAALCLVRAE